MSTSTPDVGGTPKPLHILSLDGGGVRGLSSLLLLRELMTRLAVRRGIDPPSSLRSCECFDLIIGTGTGGISALFLGRMRMTVDDAIKEYMFFAKTAFQPPKSKVFQLLKSSEAVLSCQKVERVIGDIASRFLRNYDAVLRDGSATCRTAVLACTSHHASAPPYVFRSYPTTLPASVYAVHKVACATVAIGGLFSSIKLGNPPMTFINAGLVGYNNPAEIALHEADRIQHGFQRNIACLVSIGTGLQRIVQVDQKWGRLIEVSKQIVENCESVHSSLFQRLGRDGIPYFRFNVSQGLDAHITEWGEPGSEGQLTGITAGYTRELGVEKYFDECVKVLNGEISSSTMQVHEVPGQELFSISLLCQLISIWISRKFLPFFHPFPKIFHGRQEYVRNAVSKLLKDDAAYLVILGPGGIGKTSISQAIIHDPSVKSKFGEHCRFISCEGINSVALLVDTLCAAFALNTHSVDRQKDLLQFLMHAYNITPLLVVLDNFETVWEPTPSDAESLLKAMTSVAEISLILTMRGSTRPAGLKWTKLPVVEPLDQAASHKTFMDICGNEDENLDELLQELDYIPLAVTLMGHLGETESPTQLLKMWKTEHTKLLSFSHEEHRLTNVDISIQVSLQSPRITHCPAALSLLSVISILPAGVFDGDLSKTCPNISSCNKVALILRQTGLAYFDSFQTLRVLAPIRLYIIENHPPQPQLLHDLQFFHFQLAELGWTNPGEANYQNYQRILQKSETNIEAVLIIALKTNDNDEDENVNIKIQAALGWTWFLYWTSPRDVVGQLALKLARKKKGAHLLKAQCFQSVGNIHRRFNNYDKAQEMLSNAQAEFQAISNKQGAAECLQSLGNIHRMLSNYDKAQQMLSSVQAEFQAIGDKLGVAQCLRSLGDIHRMLNNYDTAQEMLSSAQAKFQAIGGKLGAAQCLRSLGDIHRMLKNYDTAQEILSRAQVEFQALGNKQGAAQCLRSLGDVHRMLNNYKTAEEMLSRAQVEFQTIGAKLGAAQCLRSLGDIHITLNNYDLAQEILSSTQAEFKTIGNKQGAAQCLQSLGHIHLMLHNYDMAQEMLSSAQAEFQAISDKMGAAQCLQSLTSIHNTDI